MLGFSPGCLGIFLSLSLPLYSQLFSESSLFMCGTCSTAPFQQQLHSVRILSSGDSSNIWKFRMDKINIIPINMLTRRLWMCISFKGTYKLLHFALFIDSCLVVAAMTDNHKLIDINIVFFPFAKLLWV